MISDRDKSLLKKLVTSSEWNLVNLVAEELLQDIRQRSNVAETEWETLKNTLMNEGEQRGILRILQRLIDYAQQAR